VRRKFIGKQRYERLEFAISALLLDQSFNPEPDGGKALPNCPFNHASGWEILALLTSIGPAQALSNRSAKPILSFKSVE